MRKKKVMICDDNESQVQLVRQMLEPDYEVTRSHHWRDAAKDIAFNNLVELLILDLGFDKDYAGWQCLAEVSKRFPKIRVIIFSKILEESKNSDEAKKVFSEILKYKQVTAFVPTSDFKNLRVQVDITLGTSKWLRDGQLWFLHLSDTQFGGEGTPETIMGMAHTITEALSNAVEASQENDDDPKLQFPALAVVSGDHTEIGRPEQFDQAATFLETLRRDIERERHDMVGALGRNNIILVPGNRDQDWTISKARGATRAELDPALDYLNRFSWMSYSGFDAKITGGGNEWCYEPGYRLVDLSHELKVAFACVNSCKWEHNHVCQNALLEDDTLRDIGNAFDTAEGGDRVLRILVSHHSPLEMNDPTKRLKLLRKPDDSQALVSGLSRTAGINLVLSGDIHKSLIRPLDTGPDHKIYSVTAGTSRSSSRPQNCLAEFVLCGLTDLAPNNKFGRLTVVAFEYNNDTFERKNQFEGKSSISFPLHY